MPDSGETLSLLVANWITDVQRRGAHLYATHEVGQTQYLSFEGKDHVIFSLEIDRLVQNISVHITDPKSSRPTIEELALNEENLKALARRMCLVREGMAVVPTYLLAQLAILCHAYERLSAEYDRTVHIKTTTGSVAEIEAEVKRYLTPEEQRRTDNPLLGKRSDHMTKSDPDKKH
jgi:hypothetical protein